MSRAAKSPTNAAKPAPRPISPPVAGFKTAKPKAVAAGPASAPSLRQLAHELNSLLDGSMRCVGLARTSLQRHAPSAAETSVIEDGLSKAHAAMQHMAALLARAMRLDGDGASTSAAATLFESNQSFQRLADDLAGLLAPHAQAAGARLTFQIARDCTTIAAASLGPVLMNGLRNALQACETLAASDKSKPDRAVATTIERCGDTLSIAITGPSAAKVAGHRIGLALSEQIVAELGGELGLLTDDGLTTLRIGVPLGNLPGHA